LKSSRYHLEGPEEEGRWLDTMDRDTKMLQCRNWKRLAENRDAWRRPRPKLGCSAAGAGSLVVTLVPLGLTIKNSIFCSHSALMSSVHISEKSIFISLLQH